MNCYEQLDELFSLWRAEAPNEYFVEDGLMILPGKTEEEMDSLWKCSPIRMAFLAKDNNQKNARYNDFAQKWLIDPKQGKSNCNLKKAFIRKIAHLFFGLCSSNRSHVWSSSEVIGNYNLVKDYFCNKPFAFIECKKQPGGSTIQDNDLTANLNTYRKYLEEELRILDPNIFVCFGGPQYDFLIKMFEGFEIIPVAINPNNNVAHVAYIPTLKKVIVLSGHPSSRSSYINHYDGTMYWYCKFIESDYFLDMFSIK